MDGARTAPSRATYDDLARVAPEKVAELVDGVLYVHPRPRARHARAATILSVLLGQEFDDGVGRGGGWWFLVEPELHLGDDVLVPDLAAWRCDNVPALPDTAAIDIAPDWLCEVLSNSTRRTDRVVKLPVYARAGVGHVWLVDPEVRTLEVLRQHDSQWLIVATYGDTESVEAEPFAALELPLSQLWLGEDAG